MNTLRAWAMAAVFASTLSLAPVAAAQEDASESRAATFEAAEGAQTEDVPGGALLVAAYGVIWLLVFGFVASIAIRQSRTARELARLREDIKAQARTAPSGGPPNER
jgi:CcmD family protein